MHIGIDFDNTIIEYDDMYYRYGVKLNMIPDSISINKHAIRRYIKKHFGNNAWVKLQEDVYATYIAEGKKAKGLTEFLLACKSASCQVSIVSHKSRYGYFRKKINLHKAALEWLAQNGCFQFDQISVHDVHFEESLRDKILRIKKLQCTHFIDDLEKVFVHKEFPKGIAKIMYSPNSRTKSPSNVAQFKSWDT